MASNTFTIEICDEDRRRIDALCRAMRPAAAVAVVVSIETVGFTDGVHLFSDTEAAERWMLEQIRQHGGACSHYSVEEFQKRLAPYEDFWLMELHDRTQ